MYLCILKVLKIILLDNLAIQTKIELQWCCVTRCRVQNVIPSKFKEITEINLIS